MEPAAATADHHVDAMTLESLMVSRDPQAIRIMRRALEKLSIDVQVCQGANDGCQIIRQDKFDAVIVDCDDLQDGLHVLQELRKSPSNRTSVGFALLNGSTNTAKAFGMGANFVIQKPITFVNARRCLNASIGFMEREHRRYFRHPVEVPIKLVLEQGDEISATTLNISEGGMAISYSGALPKGPVSRVIFRLPGFPEALEPRAEIIWADGHSRAGIRFVEMPTSTHESLVRWMEVKFRPNG